MFGRTFAVTVTVAASLLIPSTPAMARNELKVVIDGLDNPRGLAFGPDGALYVAEAGTGGDGPCFPGEEGGDVCFGKSGALSRYKNGKLKHQVSGLPSIASPDGTNAIGPSDVSFAGRGFLTIGLGADPARRDELPYGGEKLGKLFSFEPGHQMGDTFKAVADIAGFEASQNPDGGEHDSNPQSVHATGDALAVTDAGGNALLKVGERGAIETLAVFPNGEALAPDFLGLPPGTMIPMQAVPTGLAFRDGAYYVAQLTGFPFPKGGANIYKVVPGQQPEVYASGLTNLIDIAFDEDGTLYALEIADNTLLGEQPSGMLLKIVPGQAPEVIESGLMMPGGLAIRGNHAYVTDCGTCAGDGRVLRIGL